MGSILLWASSIRDFSLGVSMGSDSIPQNSFGWEDKLRSSLCTLAFCRADSKDLDIYVLDRWMPSYWCNTVQIVFCWARPKRQLVDALCIWNFVNIIVCLWIKLFIKKKNAGSKNTPSMHHPRRWNVTASMVGLKSGHSCKNLTLSPKMWTPEI